VFHPGIYSGSWILARYCGRANKAYYSTGLMAIATWHTAATVRTDITNNHKQHVARDTVPSTRRREVERKLVMATTQRRRDATQTAAKGKTSNTETRRHPRTVSADQLADALASQLTISDGKKGKRKEAEPSVSDGEKLITSMRAVNAASQALSALAQSGWRRSTETKLVKKGSMSSAVDASESASKHLAVLRSLSPSDINVERAAISVLGKLVTLDMVRCTYFLVV
jgi:hypothetical protein